MKTQDKSPREGLKNKIKITEEALSYIREKNKNAIYISSFIPTSCCCIGMKTTRVTFSDPNGSIIYDEYEEGGIKIYVDKTLKFIDDTINISLFTYMFTKKLLAEIFIPDVPF